MVERQSKGKLRHVRDTLLLSGFFLLVLMTLSCVAASHRTYKEPVTPNSQALCASLEELIVEVVRDWYREKGYEVPPRVVISERSEKSWVVLAGPELAELEFRIDPRTKRIIEYGSSE
jgi:hypothetical protein